MLRKASKIRVYSEGKPDTVLGFLYDLNPLARKGSEGHATELSIQFRGQGRTREGRASMHQPSHRKQSLYDTNGTRKYLTTAQRRRFADALCRLPPKERLFYLLLMWTGARISEALAVTPDAVDLDVGAVSFETLKRRQRGVVRQVPVPRDFLSELTRAFQLPSRQCDPTLAHRPLWRWSRTTAWRHLKAAMATAEIVGPAATPKGLRHTFGVTAFQANVPPHIVQRWLGHASLRTTAIYADVSGPEERAFASRLWQNW